MPFFAPNFRRRSIIHISALAAMVVSLAALTGWILDLHLVKTLLPNHPEMKPNTAVGFILGSIGLLFATTPKRNRFTYTFSAACGFAVFLIGLGTLGEFVFSFDAGIDNILFPWLRSDVGNGFPLRMSTYSSVNFAIVGLALAALTGSRLWRKVSEYLACLSLVTSYGALLGFLFGAEYLYGMARSNGTAPYSVVLFAILTVGILAANFRSRSVKLLLSPSLGGAATRRLLPAIILVPTLIGWLRVEGQNYGLFDTGFGTAMSIFSSVLLMVVLIVYYSGTLHKVDLLRATFEKELTRNERQYRNLFDHSQGLICSHDLNGFIISINPAALNALGFERDEIIGQNLGSLMLPGTDDLLKAYLRNVKHEGLSEGLLSLRSKNGEVLIWRYYNILVSEPDSDPYVLGHAQDVTLLVQTQQELKDLSHTDDLTGLYNRRGFQTLAEQQIKLERHHGTARGLVLMFADLDGLKQINDKYGHQAGSDAIVAFSKVLRSVLRSADLISRWGGDEFVILTIGSPDETSEMIIDRIHARLRQHNYESDAPYELACSIGIAAVPLDGKKSFENLIAEADQSMYNEKRRRKLEPVALKSGRM